MYIGFWSVRDENIRHSKVASLNEVDTAFHKRLAVRKRCFSILVKSVFS